MAAAYKALQSKAMHNGAYIGYAIIRDQQYTTNGQIVVNHIADEHELKPLKNQLDKRVDGTPMQDMTFIHGYLSRTDTTLRLVDNGTVQEYENKAGLKLTEVEVGGITVAVQSVYLDYANALFPNIVWYVTDRAVMGFDPRGDKLLVAIAQVKEMQDEANE